MTSHYPLYPWKDRKDRAMRVQAVRRYYPYLEGDLTEESLEYYEGCMQKAEWRKHYVIPNLRY